MEEKIVNEGESTDSMPASRQLKLAIIVLLIGLGFTSTYAWLAHRSTQQMAASRDELKASLSQTQAQMDFLNAKLNALSSTPVPVAGESTTATPTVAKAAHGAQKHASTKRHAARSTEDPRLKQIQAELAEHSKQIRAAQDNIQNAQDNIQKTRSELSDNMKSTRDELNGSIAKNHDELVALEKKGERSYYEFDAEKSKVFHHVGPLSVALRKANSKKKFCDLEMLVEDTQLAKKHVNIYEPVLFYPEGYSQPLELVINQIGKDHVHGYVSAPKYKPAELAASSPQASEATASSGSTQQAATSGADVNLQRRTDPKQ